MAGDFSRRHLLRAFTTVGVSTIFASRAGAAAFSRNGGLEASEAVQSQTDATKELLQATLANFEIVRGVNLDGVEPAVMFVRVGTIPISK